MDSTACACAQRILFVGLDFGTTNSGAACVIAWYCEEHQYFAEISSTEVNKFVTVLQVSRQGGYRFVTGYEDSREGETFLTLFKLDLMAHEPWTSNREDAAASKIINGRYRGRVSTADDVTPVAVYLKGLFEHTINKRRGWIEARNATEVRVVVVLTSPVCWNTETQARFLRAAQLSGIGSQQIIGDRTLETRIVFGHEHMAALMGIARQEKPLFARSISNSGAIIVVDVGGATIDAVVSRIAPGDRPSKSRLGGSLLVESHFVDFLDDWIGKNYPLRTPEQNQIITREREKVVMTWWEGRHKLNYLPDVSSPPLEAEFIDKTLTIGREEFKGFFKDTVEIIAKVVDDLFEEELKQTGVAPTTVVLTGGLSHCAWLCKAVDLHLKESPRNLLLQHAGVKSRWNAVAIGAAYVFAPWNPHATEPQGEAPGDEGQ